MPTSKTLNVCKLFACFTALVLLAGFQSGCRRKYVLPPPSYTLPAAQLFQEYKDAKASNDKYVGKVLEISGPVDRTGQDSAGQPFLAFKGEEGVGDVQCFFPRSQSEAISKLPKGQNVTLRGVCLIKVIHVALDSCEFVQK